MQCARAPLLQVRRPVLIRTACVTPRPTASPLLQRRIIPARSASSDPSSNPAPDGNQGPQTPGQSSASPPSEPAWDRSRGWGWAKFWGIWVIGVALAFCLPSLLSGLSGEQLPAEAARHRQCAGLAADSACAGYPTLTLPPSLPPCLVVVQQTCWGRCIPTRQWRRRMCCFCRLSSSWTSCPRCTSSPRSCSYWQEGEAAAIVSHTYSQVHSTKQRTQHAYARHHTCRTWSQASRLLDRLKPLLTLPALLMLAAACPWSWPLALPSTC